MKYKKFLNLLLVAAILSLTGCAAAPTNSLIQTTMILKSPAFAEGQTLAKKYTCDGEGVSPPLEISQVPAETKSLALVLEDPDAPRGTFIHWVVWNIPPTTTEIKEGAVPGGASVGTSSAGTTAYVAACPPSGTHRYYFKLYALNDTLNLTSAATSDDLEKAMGAYLINTAELMAVYGR